MAADDTDDDADADDTWTGASRGNVSDGGNGSGDDGGGDEDCALPPKPTGIV